jgi:hypothetical protein
VVTVEKHSYRSSSLIATLLVSCSVGPNSTITDALSTRRDSQQLDCVSCGDWSIAIGSQIDRLPFVNDGQVGIKSALSVENAISQFGMLLRHDCQCLAHRLCVDINRLAITDKAA